MTINKV